MKLTKNIITSVAALALSSSSSSAALLLTFSEEGMDVVMRVSGSVDVSLGSWVEPQGSQLLVRHEIESDAVSSFDTLAPTVQIEISGIDLLALPLANVPVMGADIVSGNGDFSISGSNFFAFDNTDSGVSLNTPTITSSDKVLTFQNHSFVSLGMNSHATNTDIGLWKASPDAGDAGTVNFRISTVPEPSSTVFLGLGSCSLLFRRRR